VAFIDTVYADTLIGESARRALAPTQAAFDTFEEAARADVQSAAQAAGYALGDTTTNAMVRRLTLAAWFVHAGGFRQGLTAPAAIMQAYEDLDRVRAGSMPIPGLSPSTEDGVGGILVSSTSGRPPRLTRDKLTGF
jgi:hypothetical protein